MNYSEILVHIGQTQGKLKQAESRRAGHRTTKEEVGGGLRRTKEMHKKDKWTLFEGPDLLRGEQPPSCRSFWWRTMPWRASTMLPRKRRGSAAERRLQVFVSTISDALGRY